MAELIPAHFGTLVHRAFVEYERTRASFLSILILLSGQMDWVSADMGNRDEQTLMRFEQGMVYWKSGDRAAALAAFEAVTAQRSDYAAPIAFVFPRKGTPGLEGAREDFRTILLGPPDEAEAPRMTRTLETSLVKCVP